MVPFSLATRYEPKHPEVARINPKRQAPVLVDDGLEIFDSTQIIEYLEDRWPEPPLWPAEPRARAAARLLELKSDEVFFPQVARLIAAARNPGSAEAGEARDAIADFYDQMEARLADGPFLAGATYTYADIAFVVAHHFAAWLGAELAPGHVALDAWRRRIVARPAVRSVLEPLGAFLTANGMRPPAFATWAP
jgi:glutathione S-transferase